MPALRLRAEAQPLRAFRVSEIPDHIRYRAAHRDAYNQGRAEGLAGVPLLRYVLEVVVAANRPGDRLQYVSADAWATMEADAARMEETGAADRWRALAASPPREAVWPAGS